jgi:glutamine synthetase
MSLRAEYIWLDGNEVQLLRSKTKIIDTKEKFLTAEACPKWNFDGSSCNQADTDNSELNLHPVKTYKNPLDGGILVLCEVFTTDGQPHPSNERAKLRRTADAKDQDTWYGFEQEYVIYDNKTKRPLGFPSAIGTYPEKQGQYYCGVGGNYVAGREFVEEHLNTCLSINLHIGGVNAEVMLAQWEYQIGPVTAIEGSDELWISRYLLYRLAEKYGYYISIDPKPIKSDDWNGSGMHVNFSTKQMRENLSNKMQIAIDACEKLKLKHEEHIAVYGAGNEDRLTGSCETASYTEFKYGVGDRTASIRIPSSINDRTTKGYIEDRRPSSNANPYTVVEKLIDTIC